MGLFGYTVDGLTIPFASYNVSDGVIDDFSTNTYNYDLFEKGLNPFQLIFQKTSAIAEIENLTDNDPHSIPYDLVFRNGAKISFYFSYQMFGSGNFKIDLSCKFYEPVNKTTSNLIYLIIKYKDPNYDWSQLYGSRVDFLYNVNKLSTLLCISPNTATYQTATSLTPVYWYDIAGNHKHGCTARHNRLDQNFIRNFFYKMDDYKPDLGEDSWEEGGFGDFNDNTDDIDFGELPTVDIVSMGALNMYKMDVNKFREFNSFLWSSSLPDTIYKTINEPLNTIVSLTALPLDVGVYEEKNIILGNLIAVSNTIPISAPKITKQYITLDFGTISMKEYFGSCLDYAPYTKPPTIFLPFIGMQTLSINDCMDSDINLVYNVDMFTGTCTAMLKITKNTKMNFNSVVYTWSGNCALNIPLSGTNYMSLYSSIINSTVGVATAISTGGASALVPAVSGSAMATMNSAPLVNRGGTSSMNSAMAGVFTPYIILERPFFSKPEDFEKIQGVKSNISSTLNRGLGYVEVDNIHLDGLTATEQEKTEIENLLKQGVIL